MEDGRCLAHEKRLTRLEAEIKPLQDTYKILLEVSNVQGQILTELKQTRMDNVDIKQDVKYLKENAETKATVTNIDKRVDILERADGEHAKNMLEGIKTDISKLVLGLVIAMLIFAISIIYAVVTNKSPLGMEDHANEQTKMVRLFKCSECTGAKDSRTSSPSNDWNSSLNGRCRMDAGIISVYISGDHIPDYQFSNWPT